MIFFVIYGLISHMYLTKKFDYHKNVFDLTSVLDNVMLPFDKFMTGQGIEFDISFLIRGAPTSLTEVQKKIAEVNQHRILF